MTKRFMDWFGMTRMPFGKEVEAKDFFKYAQLEELHQILDLAIEARSAALVTGQAGTGKTTAVRLFLEQLPTNRYRVIYLGYDQTGASMFARLAVEFGLSSSFRGSRLLQLSHFIKRNILASNRELVLVVDEAHLLEWRTLEDIRLLTNSEMDSRSAMTLLMLGQLWLRSKLKSMGNEALYQRMQFRYGLEGLTKKLTNDYLRHRLTLVGCTQIIFNDAAASEIFMVSGGILREINNVALECLIRAANLELKKIDEKLVKLVVEQRETS